MAAKKKPARTKARPYSGKKRVGTIIKSKGRYRRICKVGGKKCSRACKAPKKK
jgi:hypothetical protein